MRNIVSIIVLLIFAAPITCVSQNMDQQIAASSQAVSPKPQTYTIGLLMNLSRNDGVVEVTSVAKGSPAESAGVRVGDELVAVNGERIVAMDTDENTAEILKLIHGPRHSTVDLTIVRRAARGGPILGSFTVSVKREMTVEEALQRTSSPWPKDDQVR